MSTLQQEISRRRTFAVIFPEKPGGFSGFPFD